MNTLLTQSEILEVVNALVGSDLNVANERPVLLQTINKTFVSKLAFNNKPRIQLLLDLGQMNTAVRLADGELPLEIYLSNAVLLLSDTDPAYVVIQKTLNKVRQQASGSPPIDLALVPETKEVIVHADDMVSFAFMEAGLQSAAGVMRLRVPRYENGKARVLSGGNPVIFNGTAWLLTDSLIMTNHHVINARQGDEPSASKADFELQAAGTRTEMDYDREDQEGTLAGIIRLEAHDAALDYAILRIPAVSNRTGLPRANQSVEKGNPVNIIQHPNGRSKRYAIRNNLVSAVDGNDIRYFTDTYGGSSGSPVFNDSWEVVGLHRGAKFVSEVQFQGKSTAYVNLGTALPAILEHIKASNPALRAEIDQ